MDRPLVRVSAFALRHRKVFLACWVLVLLISLPLAAKQSDHLSNGGYTAPGSQSREVEKSLNGFPGYDRQELAVVARGAGSDPQQRAAVVATVSDAAQGIVGIEVTSRASSNAALLNKRSDAIILPITVTGTYDQSVDAAVKLDQNLDSLGKELPSGVEVGIVGQDGLWAALSTLAKDDLAKAEAVGLPIVFIILLIVFGSFSAALLPLSLGAISVTIASAGVYLLSREAAVSVYVTNMVSMIGIGVAVDYSLFILMRYRQELIAGNTRDDAILTAMRTAGYAVLVSALTIVVAFAGLFVVDSNMIRSVAIGGIMVVAISLAGALTLSPILIKALGHRGRRVKKQIAASTGREEFGSQFWRRWSTAIMRRPVTALIGGTAVMVAMALSILTINTGDSALDQFPPNDGTHAALAEVAVIHGPGSLGPVLAKFTFANGDSEDQANKTVVASFSKQFAADPSVESVGPAIPSSDGDELLIPVVANVTPDSALVTALVKRVRAFDAAHGTSEGVKVIAGGTTAQTLDFRDLISGSLWKLLLTICVLSYFLLFFLLRSVILPLKAVFLTSLTVAASYGALVMIYQWGALSWLLGEPRIDYLGVTSLPLILAVTFGLTMDYQVLLLCRMNERYLATGDNDRAVFEGLASTAGSITSAALIMVAVFGTFAAVAVPGVQQLGLGLAIAVALDASLVRLVLVPAAMKLLGDLNWWVPKWADRRLRPFEDPVEVQVEANT